MCSSDLSGDHPLSYRTPSSSQDMEDDMVHYSLKHYPSPLKIPYRHAVVLGIWRLRLCPRTSRMKSSSLEDADSDSKSSHQSGSRASTWTLIKHPGTALNDPLLFSTRLLGS